MSSTESSPIAAPKGWSETQIAGRPVDLFFPDSPTPQSFVLLYLHDESGSPQIKDELFTEEVNRHGLTVVAPRCGPCWWLDVSVPMFDTELTPEQYLLQFVIPWIQANTDVGVETTKGIGLMGDGMGGQGVLKLAYKNPRGFPVTAAITPKIDFHHLVRDGHDLLTELFHEPEPARQRTPILFIQGLNWPPFQFFCCDPANYRWWDGADRLRMKLAASGIPHECELELESAGDESAYFQKILPRAVEYVATHLERERLRLV